MLNSDDKSTYFNINELVELARESKKPLVFWIGAGASCWNKFPLWGELAIDFVKVFSKKEVNFDKDKANELLNNFLLPEVFNLCAQTNKNRYNELLAGKLKPRDISPVYLRFIETLSKNNPLHIITTNIDSSLESSLKNISVISRTNLERCLSMIQNKESFVAKVHGDLSDLSSVVFTSDDYLDLVKNTDYLEILKQIFTSSTVVFIGTSLGDEYVLQKIKESYDLRKFFGSGPHFAIVKEINTSLPENLKLIKYTTTLKADHRSAIQVLEELNVGKNREVENTKTITKINLRSAHFLSTIIPPGTWKNTPSITLSDSKHVLLGLGFSQDEMHKNPVSTALDDLITGLVCFDTTYCSIEYAGSVFKLVTEPIFINLIKSESLKFVYWESTPAVVYQDSTTFSGGFISDVSIHDPDKNIKTLNNLIRKIFLPTDQNQLKQYEQFIELIESATHVIKTDEEPSITKITNDLITRPSIRALLGLSSATPLGTIPKWSGFPVLRLANTIKIGVTADLLGISSVNLDFGCADLALPAFSAVKGREYAAEVASYVVSGKHPTSAGRAIESDPNIIKSILIFRDKQQGLNLRKEIFKIICADESSDIITAINGGLVSALPAKILQEAHDTFSYLIPKKIEINGPAIFKNDQFEKSSLVKWREKCRNDLLNILKSKQSLCPCGSKELAINCCLESLKA